jgi:hypothetical protein
MRFRIGGSEKVIREAFHTFSIGSLSDSFWQRNFLGFIGYLWHFVWRRSYEVEAL